MAAKTSVCRINTESFSHVSGSVPTITHITRFNNFFFPREWECSLRGEIYEKRKFIKKDGSFSETK